MYDEKYYRNKIKSTQSSIQNVEDEITREKRNLETMIEFQTVHNTLSNRINDDFGERMYQYDNCRIDETRVKVYSVIKNVTIDMLRGSTGNNVINNKEREKVAIQNKIHEIEDEINRLNSQRNYLVNILDDYYYELKRSMESYE